MTFRHPASGPVPILKYHKSAARHPTINAPADDIFRSSIYGRSVRVGIGQSGHLPSQIFGDQDARNLERQSRCVTIAGGDCRAGSACGAPTWRVGMVACAEPERMFWLCSA
jgi:hypothetical protein